MKLKDKKTKPPKILLYGVPGTGKTALALTLGEKGFLLDLDDGLQTGLTLNDKWKNERLKIEFEPCYEDDPDKGLAYPNAKRRIVDVVSKCKRGLFKYDALIIDSLTTLADGCMRFIQGNSNRLGQNPQIQEWGLMIIEIEGLMVLLRSLPIVVILIAHEHYYELEGRTKTQLAIPCKKLPGKISSYFDEVWHLDIKNRSKGKKDFVIQTVGSGGILARSRGNLEDGLSCNLGLIELMKRMGFDFDSFSSSREKKDNRNAGIVTKKT